MKAIISRYDKNTVIVQNFDREPEKPIFEAIKSEFIKDSRITIKQEIKGPLEDIIEADCNGGEVVVYYDFDYELYPIRCTAHNIETVLEIVNNAIQKLK